MTPIEASELIINERGAIYHLNLRPDEIGDTIFLVGDPGRVEAVSKYFDQIEIRQQHREFVTHTGYIGNHKTSVVSTGIGTDNIDIVINELDALVNINFDHRTIRTQKRVLRLIRLGTSGALQSALPVDTFVASTHGIGLDGLFHYYKDTHAILDLEVQAAFNQHIPWHDGMAKAYAVAADASLLSLFKEVTHFGMTVTANGFYGPQGRMLRLPLQIPDFNERLRTFSCNGNRILNFEMETSALYALGKALGHSCLTICAIIANRESKQFSDDYKVTVDRLIKTAIDKLFVG
jgi:uridine phosphorylase